MLLIILIVAGGHPVHAQSRRDAWATAREQLVRDFVEGEGITHPAVLQAIRTVPRHEFVPPRLRRRAYADEALAIGKSQTISPPFIVAYMTESLDPRPEDRVLEIGTGSGYQAAVLAEIVDQVYSIEIVPELARTAEQRLQRLGYDNVHVRAGDGYQGWPEHAPFDRIIVTCSPESVPEPLVRQLREGGTMIIPIGERYQQAFYLLTKKDGRLEQQKLISTLFVPMTGKSEERRQLLPDPENPQLVNGSFEIDDNSDERPDGWHYQRRLTLAEENPVHGKRYAEFEADEPGQLCQALQGLAINGRQLGALDFTFWAEVEGVRRQGNQEQAGILVHFYDSVRREVGFRPVELFSGTVGWNQYRRRVLIPPKAREIVIRIGLNGTSGVLRLDDLKLTARRR